MKTRLAARGRHLLAPAGAAALVSSPVRPRLTQRGFVDPTVEEEPPLIDRGRRVPRLPLCPPREHRGDGDHSCYTLSADATAIYACINGGNNHPKAANKETVQGQVSGGGTFTPQNGRVQESLTAGPLSAGSFTCPSGQRLVLAKVTYTNIVLTDTTNNVVANPPDVCRSFLPALFPC
jgi:hypothetical protein